MVSQPRVVLTRPPPLRDSVAGRKFSAPCLSLPRWVLPAGEAGWPTGSKSEGDVPDTLCILLSMSGTVTGGKSGCPEKAPLYLPYIFGAKRRGLSKIFFKKHPQSPDSPSNTFFYRIYVASLTACNFSFAHAQKVIGN